MIPSLVRPTISEGQVGLGVLTILTVVIGSLLRYLDLNEEYLEELEQEIAQPNQTLNQHAWRYREGLEARIAETREIIAKLRAEFTAEFAARR